jgi:hypothetical protein
MAVKDTSFHLIKTKQTNKKLDQLGTLKILVNIIQLVFSFVQWLSGWYHFPGAI